MNTTKSNVVGNKTARSCDSCSSRRAIWFCAADDAFLCQSCDTSVHSANQLARRHERVRLEKPPSTSYLAWHQGITKKPRTPRSRKRLQKQHHDGDDSNVEAVLVPEFTSEESFSPNDQNEEQYRVPVLDLLEEGEISNGFDVVIGKDSEFDLDSLLNEHEVSTMNLFPEFMETDVVELQDYLGTKTGEGSCKGLSSELGFEGGLKVEEDNYQDDFYCNSLGRLDIAGESSNWDFEEETATDHFYCDSVGMEMTRGQSSNWDFEGGYSSSPPRVEEKEVREKEKRRINLKLNHEAIIYAWDCQDSPWMNGIKPDFNLVDDHCWFDFMGSGCTLNDEDPNGAKSGRTGSGSGSGRFDEEREARVLRYKEKRRTRLFAKKIRYQVRKLNAEKRPRMKGRFVKRSTAMAPPPSSSLPCYMQMNKQTMM